LETSEYFIQSFHWQCRPSSVVSGGVVVVGVCNGSQMRTSKCTYLIFSVSIGLDPG